MYRKKYRLLAQNGDGLVVVADKHDPRAIPDLPLLVVVDGQHDGHRHVDNPRPVIIISDRVEMKCLEELRLSHEPAKGAGPTLAQHVDPLEVDPRQPDAGQTRPG